MFLHAWLFCWFTFVSVRCSDVLSTMTILGVAVVKGDGGFIGIMAKSPPGYR
jgi:hypothetical protein